MGGRMDGGREGGRGIRNEGGREEGRGQVRKVCTKNIEERREEGRER